MQEPLQPGFGCRLRETRLNAGLKQTDLARAGLTQSYLSHLEAGRREPSADTVDALASLLGVTRDVLTGQPPAVAAGLVLLGRADMLTAGGHFDEAAALFGQALHDSQVRASTEWPRPILGLAEAHERAGDLDSAVRLLEQALPRAIEDLAANADEVGPGPVRHYTCMCTVLARCYREAGDLSRAVDVATAAVDRIGPLRPRATGFAPLVATLASAHADRGDLLRATQLLDDLLADARDRDDRAAEAAALWNAGLVAAERGRALDALRHMDRATGLVAAQRDDRALARMRISQAWLLLAGPAPNARKAESLLLSAMPDLQRHATMTDVASAHTELARACLLLGRPEDAAAYAGTAESLLSKHPNLESARAAALLGRAVLTTGETDAGLQHLDRAARVLSGFGSTREAASVWRSLAEAYASAGLAEHALSAYSHALDTLGVAGEPVAEPLLTTRGSH